MISQKDSRKRFRKRILQKGFTEAKVFYKRILPKDFARGFRERILSKDFRKGFSKAFRKRIPRKDFRRGSPARARCSPAPGSSPPPGAFFCARRPVSRQRRDPRPALRNLMGHSQLDRLVLCAHDMPWCGCGRAAPSMCGCDRAAPRKCLLEADHCATPGALFSRPGFEPPRRTFFCARRPTGVRGRLCAT